MEMATAQFFHRTFPAGRLTVPSLFVTLVTFCSDINIHIDKSTTGGLEEISTTDRLQVTRSVLYFFDIVYTLLNVINFLLFIR